MQRVCAERHHVEESSLWEEFRVHLAKWREEEAIDIIRQFTNVNDTNAEDFRLIDLAAYYSTPKVIRALAEAGAELDTPRAPHHPTETPLYIAAINRQSRSFIALIGAGASPNVGPIDGCQIVINSINKHLNTPEEKLAKYDRFMREIDKIFGEVILSDSAQVNLMAAKARFLACRNSIAEQLGLAPIGGSFIDYVVASLPSVVAGLFCHSNSGAQSAHLQAEAAPAVKNTKCQ